MARTNRPHPRSKLYLATRLREELRDLHRQVSVNFSPTDYAQIRPRLAPAEARYCDARNRDILDLLRGDVRQRMLDQNVSAAIVADPTMQAFIAAQAERDRVVKLAHEPPPPPPMPLDEDWRPARDLVVMIIVGEHLAFGDGNRVRTANRLNDGIPPANSAEKLDDDAVRHALLTYIGQRRVLGDEGLIAEALGAMLQAARLDFIWSRLQPRLGPIEARREGAIDRLIAEGVPLDLFMDSLHVVAVPEFSDASMLELASQELRWRRRHNAPRPRALSARTRRQSGT